MRLKTLFSTAMLATAILLGGCQTTTEKNSANTINWFEADEDGRIHVFYDKETFSQFKQVGETAYRLTRIGGGPNGETLVFGLTKADKKLGENTPAAMLWDGKQDVSSFYGEMHKHGRIYVFDNKADMDFVRKVGEPSYMYTQIGAGPKGETVVFVLNKANKKQKPESLMAQFAAMHK
ncbi:hypothetical protein [Thiomicrorhabdus sediminis]|uniref:Lipoprotein n=1 Tax=Thiomicrorhabdus sediminis TaxID=2580412 RepID=A0A4P9K8Q7_9GAMM|nr:hypothetical protein [Thiomicrorhabdus sediminis]QCU90850.1 hypothetical protein FE785_09525 [Thiomicrorhabdus sediminis]